MAMTLDAGALGSTLGDDRRDNLFQKSLTASLRLRSEELKTLQSQRENLRNKIQDLWHRLDEIESEYWATGLTALQRYVANHGDGDSHFNQWRADYAKERSLHVKNTREQQKRMRQHIAEYEDELSTVDTSFWASIQSTIDDVASAPLLLEPPRPRPSGTRIIKRIRLHRTARQRSLSRPARLSPPSAAAASRPSLRDTGSPASPASPVPPTTPAAVKNTIKIRQWKKPQPTRPVTRPVTRPDPTSFQGVTDAAPGQFYQAYYPSSVGDEGWYMGYVLPWNGDEWEQDVALQFSMRQIDLKPDWPKCYIPALTSIEREDEHGSIVTESIITGIKGWAPGFEDGGPFVQDRVFLFLYFDDAPHPKSRKLRVPKKAGGKITFNKVQMASGNLPIDWVSAAHLRAVGVDVGSTVRGRQMTRDFQKMLERLDATRREQSLHDGSPQATQATQEAANAAPVAACSPNVDTSGQELQAVGESTSQRGMQAHATFPSLHVAPTMHVVEHGGKLEGFKFPPRTPLPNSPRRGRRLSDHSSGGDDAHSDEGIIMDYDLEVEKSAS